ncbi:hypothetical protein TYRP_004728 [Tyrophagus putrescentiae]|nr:hypothetical protein TYRP_004728 [Tyrophagus putrescentiae]
MTHRFTSPATSSPSSPSLHASSSSNEAALSCIIRQRLLLWKIKTCLILDKSKRLPSKVDQGMLNDLRAKFVELKLKQLLFEDLLKSIEANADIFKSEI